MKKLTVLTAATACALFITTGCSKSKEVQPAITASFDGRLFQATYTTAYYNDLKLRINGSAVTSNDSSHIYIGVLSNVRVNLPDPLYDSEIEYSKKDGTTYSGDSFYGGHGSLKLLSWDSSGRKVSAIFDAVLYNTKDHRDSIVVTNGQLAVKYSPE